MLRRIYGKEQLANHNYGTTLSSATFAGTIVGMLLFGYLSDKIGTLVCHNTPNFFSHSPGRKFGMVSGLPPTRLDR